MKSFFSSALSWSQGFSTSWARAAAWRPGITPSFFWLAKMVSRSFS
jgi:hypothetical protein